MELCLRSVICHHGQSGVNLYNVQVNKWITKSKGMTYRSLQALGVPGQSVQVGGKFVSPTHIALLRTGKYSW